MCNKNTLRSPDHHHHHHHHRRRRHHNQLKPARKSRTKTRKPKFLSLSKEIKPQTTPKPTSEITEMTRHHHQLNLFPLHPENLVCDDRADEDAALLFHSDGGGGGGGAASLSTLLHTTTTTTNNTMSSEEDSLSYAYEEEELLSYKCGGGGRVEAETLVKTAMRNRERDLSEEKWVCYSEVVEKKEVVEAEEVTSSSETTAMNKGNLSLKLDYQGILNAWSDKGSLYIQGSDRQSPQTVPDLHDHHDHFFASDYNTANGLMEGWRNAGNLWKVPERPGSGSGLKIKEEMEGKDGWKMGQREASVLRYKEKRRSRLFAKRIRYEVRKLNAEKRPRMKVTNFILADHVSKEN
ncbi:Protein CHLOROPLAST IMPORT APPARATUS 2 [Morus notabilis]|uniref:Protein CHLOROPLAST IMPORT APPARATUS 2 n=1 Tax=Morus notabilis TaxID=981085 RepID=W9SWY4_9ROSA|nr:Protein CHLOROPLAST IMPORT APPARATUS 2 [Morus notabilis]